jgi:hypothetical protein
MTDFKVGDQVKNIFSTLFEEGEVLEVLDRMETSPRIFFCSSVPVPSQVDLGKGAWWVDEDQIESIDSPEKRRFKVGDIATVSGDWSSHVFSIGQQVQITEVFCAGQPDENYDVVGVYPALPLVSALYWHELR